MKKLMILVIAAAATVAAQAATVSWGANRGAAKSYANKTVYLVDGVDYNAMIAALTAGGDGVEAAFKAYVKGQGTIGSTGAMTAISTALSGTNAETKGAFVIFDSTIADGNTYQTTGLMDLSQYAYSGQESVSKTIAIADGFFTTTGQKIGGSTPTPEPTSGLLLVLGMAGLALRRRRA